MNSKPVGRWVLAAFAAAGIGLWQAPQAFAQRGPCAEEMMKYCKDVQPGQGRIFGCMQEHENDLSPACKAHVAQMKEKRREMHEACSDDALRLCGNVKPGGGRMRDCLKEHENELSPQCKEKFGERGHGRRRGQ